MIIKRIRLENWRNFVTPFEIELNDGITILTGANGQGKSTIVEAMRRAFFDRSTSSGESTRALQPWGRDLAPRVEIEFVTAESNYLLSKQFIISTQCSVSRYEDGVWRNFKEGEAAEEWVRTLLHGQASAKGFSRPDHWGLTRILWIAQGENDYYGISETLRSLIAAPGRLELSDGAGHTGRLEETLRRHYNEYFTDKGTPRNTPGSIKEAAELLEGDRRRVSDLRVQLAQIDKYDTAAREAAYSVMEYRRQIDARTASFKTAENEARQFQADSLAAAQCRTKAVEIEREKESLKSCMAQLTEAAAEMERVSREKTGALHEQDKYTQALKTAETAAIEAHRALGRLEADAEKVKAAKTEATAAAHYTETIRDHTSLESRKIAVDRLNAEIKKLQEQIGAERAPDKKELQELRAALEDTTVARRELSALQLGLQFTAQQQVQVTTLSGTPGGKQTVPAGETVTVEGVGALEVVIEGTGVIRVKGPIDKGAAQLSKKITALEQHIARLDERFGTRNPEVLQDRLANVQLFANECDHKKNEIKRILGEFTYQRLIERIAELDATIDDVRNRYPAWIAQFPDTAILHEHAQRLHEDFTRKTHSASIDAERARNETELLRSKIADAATRAATAVQRLEGLEIKCCRLHGGESDEALRIRLETITGQHLITVHELAGQEEKLRTYNGNPDGRLASLKTTIDDLRRLLAVKEAEQRTAVTEIKVRGGKGLYSELAELEERLNGAASSLAARQLRASALKLLFDTIAEIRLQEREHFATPVAERASQLFRKINGRRPGAISFGPNMEVEGFLPAETAAAGQVVPVAANLSGGEQEQLYLAARLALAEQLVPHGGERHLVVLDDFLTATDDARLASIKDLIISMKERFQFLILTCHPERYMGLGDMVEVR